MSSESRARGESVPVQHRFLLAMEDELLDLASLLDCPARICTLIEVLREITDLESTDRQRALADRIADLPWPTFGTLQQHLSDEAGALAQQLDEAALTDLTAAAETITTAIQYRLHRLQTVLQMIRTARESGTDQEPPPVP